MPKHKSSKKRMKTSAVANLQNRAEKSRMKKLVKELRECKTKEEAEQKLTHVISIIDKASRNKTIHKNKAARDKSRLVAQIRKMEVPTA
ncbi:MAG: 30S ribosomal protein S20 [candidate division Zixibacteria bacterium]|nr:30S ribosomal protein S20 [candidate division Zixibacteria bacterium]